MNHISIIGRLGLLAALTVSGATHAAAEPAGAPTAADPAAAAAAPAPQVAAAAPAEAASPGGDDVVKCRIIQPTGTRLGKRKYCMTNKEWAELARESGAATTRIQNTNQSLKSQ